MRENAHTMGDLYRQRVAQRNTMSALDDMKQYEQITQANADGTKRLVDAFEPLYASLSPDQKKLADANFRQAADASTDAARGIIMRTQRRRRQRPSPSRKRPC